MTPTPTQQSDAETVAAHALVDLETSISDPLANSSSANKSNGAPRQSQRGQGTRIANRSTNSNTSSNPGTSTTREGMAPQRRGSFAHITELASNFQPRHTSTSTSNLRPAASKSASNATAPPDDCAAASRPSVDNTSASASASANTNVTRSHTASMPASSSSGPAKATKTRKRVTPSIISQGTTAKRSKTSTGGATPQIDPSGVDIDAFLDILHDDDDNDDE